MNYQGGDIVKYRPSGEMGIIIKRHHPCADFWHVALPSTIGIFHGSELKPLEKK